MHTNHYKCSLGIHSSTPTSISTKNAGRTSPCHSSVPLAHSAYTPYDTTNYPSHAPSILTPDAQYRTQTLSSARKTHTLFITLSLFFRTRQSQQINPLHFIAPIIDKSLVKQEHILRILHHHIPCVHSLPPSFLRLLQLIREAFHSSIASRQAVPVIIHIQLPSIPPSSLTCCTAFRFRCEHTFRITQSRSSFLFFGATFTVLRFSAKPQSYAIAQSRREVQFDRIASKFWINTQGRITAAFSEFRIESGRDMSSS